MELNKYISESRGNGLKLAEKLGVSLSFVSQMAHSKTSISPARAVLIEQITGGRVGRKDIFPNDWHLIWPELKDGNGIA